MGADQHPEWRATAASLVDWWVEAGLDTLVDDRARDWLAAEAAPAAPTAPSAPPAPSTTPALPVAALPPDWAAFAAWRCGEEAPEAGWPGGWIAASGPDRAEVMVLADCPDRDDLREDPCALLSGGAGRLFDRMLASIGLARDEVHLAAVCAKRPVAGRLPAEATDRLAQVTLHHVALVRPRVLLLLGNAASRAVLAIDARDARGRLHLINHEGRQAGDEQAQGGQEQGGQEQGETRVIASLHPRFLLERPTFKADAWADLRALKRARELP